VVLRGRARTGRGLLVPPGSELFFRCAEDTLRRVPGMGRVFGIRWDRRAGLTEEQRETLIRQLAVVRMELDAEAAPAGFRIRHELEIDAPPEIVWRVIADLAAYGEWNPFVIACESSLDPGDPILMRVHVFASFAQAQRETVLEHEPGERLCYGLEGGALGALASRRCHRVTSAGPGRTRYESDFELSGWLAPFVRALVGSRLQRGFDAMAVALERRALALVSAPGSSSGAAP
jgi:uncharacterized protein YndB with AHSA1/START domain